MRVPNYTKGLVLERAVPNQVDLGRIQEAGSTFEGAAKVLDAAGQIRKQVEVANELTAVNGAIIKRQKDDLDVLPQKQKERQDNPFGFAKDLDAFYKKRDEEYIKTLPTERAKADYQQKAEILNLRNYEGNLSWETKRSAEMFVNKAEQSAKDLAVLAYNGMPLYEAKILLDDSAKALDGVVASDELAKFKAKELERIASSSIDGLIHRNPDEAKRVLDSGEYDSALGAEGLEKRHSSIKADQERREAKAERRQLQEDRRIEREAKKAERDEARLIKADEKREEALKKAFDEQEKKEKLAVTNQAYTVLSSENPLDLIDDIDAGEYTGYFDEKEKAEFKQKARDAFAAQADKVAVDQFINYSETNPRVYTAYKNGKLNLADLAQLESDGGDPVALEYMRKGLLKRNPVSLEAQQDALVELTDEITAFDITTKKGKVEYKASLEQLVKFQHKVMRMESEGLITKQRAGSFINNIITPKLQAAKKEEGYDDVDFFDGAEPYDAAFQVVQDYLERNNQQNNIPLKAEMLSVAIMEADKLDMESFKTLEEKDNALKAVAERTLKRVGNDKNPVNRTLVDSPNANIKPDGSVNRIGNFETKLPASTKAKSEFKIMEDANGNRARVYTNANGDVTKVEEF